MDATAPSTITAEKSSDKLRSICAAVYYSTPTRPISAVTEAAPSGEGHSRDRRREASSKHAFPKIWGARNAYRASKENYRDDAAAPTFIAAVSFLMPICGAHFLVWAPRSKTTTLS